MSNAFLSAAAAAVITALLRFLPFLIFGKNAAMPPSLRRIAAALPPAVMGILVVYCLKDIGGAHTLASLIAAAAVAGLHLWKKNTFLSISAGTVIYMILIRVPLP